MKLKNSNYYLPYQTLEDQDYSFADFSKGKNYYNQLAFIFELASSHNSQTEREVDFLIKVAKTYVKHRPVFMDAACGSGRHSNLLSMRGYKIYAFDSSSKLLRIAKKRDRKSIYKNADFRDFHFSTKVDCIFSFWEAYNYLSKKDDIRTFLGNCFNSLNENGIVILDSRNFWKTGAEKETIQNRKYQTKDYDIELSIKKRTFLNDKVHEGIFDYTLKNRKTNKLNRVIDQELVRIWQPTELEAYSGGRLRVERIFGDFDIHSSYRKYSSKRMIIVLRKIEKHV